MPATAERVWRAIEDARAGTLADPWREPPAAFDALPAHPEAKQPEEQINL
jgi:carbon-monoxide dehydrogenase large subunit